MFPNRTEPKEDEREGDRLGLPSKILNLFYAPHEDPSGEVRKRYVPSRYKVAYGGRGSGKSWGFAGILVALTENRRLRVLCARELQNSIQESVHKLLSVQIERFGMMRDFNITQTNISNRRTGSEFIFSGIRSNPTKIKSMEGIDICWVEEAERVSEESWNILIPTIRKPGSEIWVSFNPDQETDPTYRRFVKNMPPNTRRTKINWRDNQYFPAELTAEKNFMARVDPNGYQHIWEGECRNASDAQILRNKYTIEGFVPGDKWEGPYYGADWGFAQDPTTLIKCWIHDHKLFIEAEAYAVGVDIDETPQLFDNSVPGCQRAVIRADSARPETISYMQRHGYPNIKGVEKWAGSVEDGIAFMRSFEQIVIHPSCVHTAQEARLYSYKTDRLTNDVLPVVVDANNHCMDAIRYALAPLIRRVPNAGLLDLARAELKTERERKEDPQEAKKQSPQAERNNLPGWAN